MNDFYNYSIKLPIKMIKIISTIPPHIYITVTRAKKIFGSMHVDGRNISGSRNEQQDKSWVLTQITSLQLKDRTTMDDNDNLTPWWHPWMLLVRKGRMLFQFSDTVKASGFRVYTIAEYEYGLYIKVVHACVAGLFISVDFDHYRLYLQTI
jgi:hypothetical protein